jgi:hypothetical protein
MFMTIALVFLFAYISPMQVTVPIKVDIIVAKIAIDNVFQSVPIIVSSWNKSTYHFKVNPPHFALDLLALNESTIKVKIGAYINIKIKAI